MKKNNIVFHITLYKTTLKFAVKKSFKTRPNTPYGGETSYYSLLQGGVISGCPEHRPGNPLL